MNPRGQTSEKRQRAPSKRSLATRARILDAAEKVFALKGFDGATIRDVAAEAGEAVSLVHHHGGGKVALFRQTVARRADDLAAARLAALAEARAAGPLSLDATLGAFFGPYLELAKTGPHWLAYARLVAHASTDPRWREIAAEQFDPTAEVFIAEIAATLPGAPRRALAAGFVFSVSSMLALLTAGWRIDALGAGESVEGDAADLDRLVAFCAAGIRAAAT